jgi:hypothetical protein
LNGGSFRKDIYNASGLPLNQTARINQCLPMICGGKMKKIQDIEKQKQLLIVVFLGDTADYAFYL